MRLFRSQQAQNRTQAGQDFEAGRSRKIGMVIAAEIFDASMSSLFCSLIMVMQYIMLGIVVAIDDMV